LKRLKKYIVNAKNYINLADKMITILGIIFIFIGIYQIYSPAAWIVLGVILAFPGMPRKKVK
jgi:hypothetical protein